MATLKELFTKVRFSERRGDRRSPAGELNVSVGMGPEQKQLRIKDISPTGIYVFTEDRWEPGTSVQVTLHGHTVAGESPRLYVRLQARSVRLGEDGVGLRFEQDPSDGDAWASAVAKAEVLIGKDDPVRLFRMTKDLVFLLHVSPSIGGPVLELLSNKMNREGAERAIEMVLKAEDLLISRNCRIRSDVSPTLVLQILEDGPKPDEQQTRQMWTELLATSCMVGTNDVESMKYAVLLSEMDELEMRVFIAACTRAMRAGWKPGFQFCRNLHCPMDEIRQISRIQDAVSIERIMNHLYGLGLLERTDRPLVFARIEEVNLTPTVLGLTLYARCNGQLELPESLEGSELQRAS